MDGDTLINALIGAVVTIVTSFVPFSPILGGGVAAWLEKGDRTEGAKVGAVSGALISLLLLPLLFFGIVLAPLDFGFTFVIMLFVVMFGAAYLIGFGALGGYLGAYIREEHEGSDTGSTGTQATLDSQFDGDERS
ncbi:hypothetical protein AArcSl_2115 [Halalkaliarchaeum desulfuricum]|uniref:DUF5518 domain-containing protein n=1 Tax=Halalkaliarchaeum desulfuricum TaxID=2055893 RepID=A0A343TKW8_9EURY|nr:DUF5518 domain-containing protein [Halalkaliarchaeum desulfuricum]AUX09740.1 hypothetical protein AArcSl_2115 [Halalkaliarchaeum desulfuricum]